jgi:hypothetical protein
LVALIILVALAYSVTPIALVGPIAPVVPIFPLAPIVFTTLVTWFLISNPKFPRRLILPGVYV